MPVRPNLDKDYIEMAIMKLIETLLVAVGIYCSVGFVFGVVFALWGVAKLDDAARGTSGWFRLLLIPGSIILWPVLLYKWIGVYRGT